ncbi:DUF2142 domain-containing protein [Dorea formicigenerans]|uniref:DUF2142 domain-containing protein n=1 Tax=Dorea formicigenerans TaxID=39486 RepID=A0A415H1B7_9FIRM|nr:DUF2142 domain-containing protein [Dorea formicigenerans]
MCAGNGNYYRTGVCHILAVDDPSVVYQLYFARFFNLLFYVAVIAISIRLTPILKKTFATIALMPMALFQAATVSYDPVLIALAFLATSLIFNIAFNEEVRQMELKHLILLGGIAYVFYAVKIVYLPLLFFILCGKDSIFTFIIFIINCTKRKMGG